MLETHLKYGAAPVPFTDALYGKPVDSGASKFLTSVVYGVFRFFQVILASLKFFVGILLGWIFGYLSGRNLAGRQLILAAQLVDYLKGLGGAFVKLGQFLATRSDFLPPIYCEKLSELLDDVPPFSDDLAAEVLREELGPDALNLFQGGLGKPIAAASFGQVYCVLLWDGRDVAIKVQRPEARRNVRTDVFLLSRLASIVDFSMMLKNVDLSSIVNAFKQWTREELDYRLEARSAETMRFNSLKPFGAQAAGYFPAVYWDLTTDRVLALEFLQGTWFSDLLRPDSPENNELLRMPDERRYQLAHSIFYVFLKQVFVDGFFHGDPHPGNIVLLKDDVIGMVDFGIKGTMSRSLQEHMMRVLRFASVNDTRRTFYAATEMFDIPSEVNIKRLQAEYEQNLEEWFQAANDARATRQEKSFASLLLKNIETVRRFGIVLPTNLFRYYRSFITLDPILQEIAPKFNITDEMRVFFQQLHYRDLLSDFDLTKYVQAALQYQRLGLMLPQQADIILRTFDRVPQQIVDYERRVRMFSAAIFANLSRLSWLGATYLVVTTYIWKGTPILWRGSIYQLSASKLPLLLGIAVLAAWIARRLRYRSGSM